MPGKYNMEIEHNGLATKEEMEAMRRQMEEMMEDPDFFPEDIEEEDPDEEDSLHMQLLIEHLDRLKNGEKASLQDIIASAPEPIDPNSFTIGLLEL
ncbi:hypothetical protein [Leptospira soteropolitanensis]|uniref:Uncharacterized protein n=2 Tax=Leptospira soteropolitanensis TaxID=2950025 RepID=A0AAW5VG53_9LEPT|nr:hypothetical protein [Leptospira soteropolitanensis]MCW7500601.1 hypothetical protein [Leptospira soteropolitanensis]MCW7530571.1 hypothetical protein [Leptospira soteropolitanensis]